MRRSASPVGTIVLLVVDDQLIPVGRSVETIRDHSQERHKDFSVPGVAAEK
jgi:hypothetical protein